MPKVPTLRQGLRLNPSNPTGFQSTSSARRQGNLIAGVGAGIAKVGGALADLESKQKALQGKLAERDMEQELTKEVDTIVTELGRRVGTSDKDPEDYRIFTEGVRSEVMRKMDLKYDGKYSANFGLIADEIINGRANKVLVKSYDKRDKELKKSLVESLSKSNGEIFINPEGSQAIISGAVRQNTEAMEIFGASDKEVENASKVLSRGLVDSAIDGLIDRGDTGSFLLAKEMVLIEYSEFFAADQRKIIDRINKAQRQSILLDDREAKATERAQEETLKKFKQQNFTNKLVALEKAKQSKNPKLAAKIEAQILDDANRGKISGAQLKSLISVRDKGAKKISAYSNYSITRDIYNAYEGKDFDAIRADIKYRVEEKGSLTSTQGAALERTIAIRKKSFDNNPKFKGLMKGYTTKLQGFQEQKDIFAKIGLGPDLKRRLDKDAMGEFQILAAKTGNPAQAYRTVLSQFYRGSLASVTGARYKGYVDDITTREELLKFFKWGKRTIKNTKEFNNEFKPFLKKAKAFVEAQERISAILKEEEGEKKAGSRKPQSESPIELWESSEGLINDLNEVDVEEDGEVSLLEQMEIEEQLVMWS